MIRKIAEHLVDIELLPIRAKILDLGCRGFQFTSALRSMGHWVIPVDIDVLDHKEYFRCAISDFDGLCGLSRSFDAQATKIDKMSNGIDCYKLESFSKMMKVDFWDLIKYDIEGAEYESIMTLNNAPAAQLSIEFHLHTGIYKQHEVDLMIDKLKSLGYRIASHEYTSQHGSGFNYWDSLFIL